MSGSKSNRVSVALAELCAEGLILIEGDKITLTPKGRETIPSRGADYFVFFTGMLHELKDDGLIFNEKELDTLSEKGVARFEEMRASGWIPSDDVALENLSGFCGNVEAARILWRRMKVRLANEMVCLECGSDRVTVMACVNKHEFFGCHECMEQGRPFSISGGENVVGCPYCNRPDLIEAERVFLGM